MVRPAVSAPARAHQGICRHPPPGHRPRGARQLRRQALPAPPAGGTGLGKPLRSILHPYRSEIPVYLGAEGPPNVALAAEIADGWLAMFFSPAINDFSPPPPRASPAAGARHSSETFDVVAARSASSPMTTSNARPTACGPLSRSTSAAWAPAGLNFHYEVFAGMGYEGQARAIQDAYLAGDKKSAIAAVPTRLVEDVALIGPWPKIAGELQRWKQTVIHDPPGRCDLRLLDKVTDLSPKLI